jgi:hypothetical protein
LKKKGYIEEMIARSSSKISDPIPTIFGGAEIRGGIIYWILFSSGFPIKGSIAAGKFSHIFFFLLQPEAYNFSAANQIYAASVLNLSRY